MIRAHSLLRSLPGGDPDRTATRRLGTAATIDTLDPLPTSLMPGELLHDLTAEQSADLRAALESLREIRGPPVTPAR